MCVVCGCWCVSFAYCIWNDVCNAHCEAGQACRPPRALTLSLTFLPFPGSEPHTESPLLSLCPSVHDHCEGSGNSSTHTHQHVSFQLTALSLSAPDLPQIAPFIFPNTAAEDLRRAGVWPGSREARKGGSECSFVRSNSCI